jgi:hypothetical protein
MTKCHLSLEITQWVAPGLAVPRNCELSYDAGDPLAVTVDFGVDGAQPVRWSFSRDLLADGIALRSGNGDVVLWPVHGTDGTGTPASFRVRLGSTRTALFEFPLGPVAWWLAGTYALVSQGTELDGVDWDQLVQPAE